MKDVEEGSKAPEFEEDKDMKTLGMKEILAMEGDEPSEEENGFEDGIEEVDG